MFKDIYKDIDLFTMQSILLDFIEVEGFIAMSNIIYVGNHKDFGCFLIFDTDVARFAFGKSHNNLFYVIADTDFSEDMIDVLSLIKLRSCNARYIKIKDYEYIVGVNKGLYSAFGIIKDIYTKLQWDLDDIDISDYVEYEDEEL
jgi:hypothetical protein